MDALIMEMVLPVHGSENYASAALKVEVMCSLEFKAIPSQIIVMEDAHT